MANDTNQIEGLDHAETFSPVVKPITILVLTVALTKGWKICQIDNGNAFLNDILEERSLMRQLVGFINQYPHCDCRLKKFIYRLKQSSWAWFQRLCDLLVSFGFKGSLADPSLFIYSGDYTIYVLVYVDDIVITGSDQSQINILLERLSLEFTVMILRELSYFLGIQVCWQANSIFLDQKTCLIDLFQSTGFDNLRPSTTPIESSLDLVSSEDPID